MKGGYGHVISKNGAVAQLGERQNRTLEAGGSIPLCSTNKKGVRHRQVSNPFVFLALSHYFCTMVFRWFMGSDQVNYLKL